MSLLWCGLRDSTQIFSPPVGSASYHNLQSLRCLVVISGCSPFWHLSTLLCSQGIPLSGPPSRQWWHQAAFLTAGSTAFGRRVTSPNKLMKRNHLVTPEKPSDVQNEKKKTEDFFVNSQILCEGDSVVTFK